MLNSVGSFEIDFWEEEREGESSLIKTLIIEKHQEKIIEKTWICF